MCSSDLNILYAVFAALGVILSAVYMLWMVQRTFYGDTPEEVKHHVPDMTGREWAAMIPLLILMVWMGVGTQSFLPPIRANNQKTLEMVQPQAPAVAAAETPAQKAGEVRHAH